jgi:hypothetical protein
MEANRIAEQKRQADARRLADEQRRRGNGKK